MAQRATLEFVHQDIPSCSSVPPASQCWVGSSRLFPTAIPFPLKKRWLSARNPLDHCHILLSAQTTAGGRHLTDQHLFKWKTLCKLDLHETQMILQPLPPPWQGVSSPLHQHFSGGVSTSHAVVLWNATGTENPPGALCWGVENLQHQPSAAGGQEYIGLSSKHSQVLKRPASVWEVQNYHFPLLTALLWWTGHHKHYRYS